MQQAYADSRYSQYDHNTFLEPPAARDLHRHIPSKDKLSPKSLTTSASSTKPTGPLFKQSSTSCMSQSGRSATELPTARHPIQNKSTKHELSQHKSISTSSTDIIFTGPFVAEPSRHYHQHTLSKNELSQPKFPLFSHSDAKPSTPAFKQSQTSSECQSQRPTTLPSAAGQVHEDTPSEDKLSQSEPPHTNSKPTAPVPKRSQPSSLTDSLKLPTT